MSNGTQHSEAISGTPAERLTRDASAVFMEERQNMYYAASLLKQSVAAAFPYRFSTAPNTTATDVTPNTSSAEQLMTSFASEVSATSNTTQNFAYVPDPPQEAVIFDDEQLRHVTSARAQVIAAIEGAVDRTIEYDRKDDVELAG